MGVARQRNGLVHAGDDFVGDALGIFELVQGREQDGELIAAQARYQVALAQLCPHARGDGYQHGVTGGMPEVIVDIFEAVAVEEQHRHPLVELGCTAQRTDQPALEESAIGQPGEAVMAGLVGEGFVFALQVGLPRFEFVEQGIEVIAQAVEFGDLCRRHAPVEGPLAARGVGDVGQAVQGAGDTAQHAARQVNRDPAA